jgi:hypothetical protein
MGLVLPTAYAGLESSHKILNNLTRLSLLYEPLTLSKIYPPYLPQVLYKILNYSDIVTGLQMRE